MSLEQEFDGEMLAVYERAGKEIGYWATRFLSSVKKNGGLATAKRMLGPASSSQIQKGLQALIDAGRPDLSLEALVLRPRFVALFTPGELQEAKRRLEALPPLRQPVSPEDNFPEVLPEGRTYAEGSVKNVTVNMHERDRKARAACIKKRGTRCAVCQMSFAETYGEIGKGFIHIHHTKPLATIRGEYRVDPVKDLVPVCPNCHAMLHTSEPPLSIHELQAETGDH